MMKTKVIGVSLLMAVLMVGCATPAGAPAATTVPPAVEMTPLAPTESPAEPTPVPDAPTTPAVAETPTAETSVGTGEAPPTFLDTGTAVVESLEVRFLESFPVQVQAVVTGYLPDGCTTITGVEALNASTTFRIRITTERPADAMCAMVIVKFEEVVPLETAGLPAGTYDVRVNDLMVTFELAGDGGAAQPPVGEQTGAGMHPDAGAHPVAETPTEFVLANVDVPMYDAPSAEAAEIGVIFGGQIARVTGASPDGAYWRVMCPDDTVGDCWVSAAPEFTVPQAASN